MPYPSAWLGEQRSGAVRAQLLDHSIDGRAVSQFWVVIRLPCRIARKVLEECAELQAPELARRRPGYYLAPS
jgi:hypothetical protein